VSFDSPGPSAAFAPPPQLEAHEPDSTKRGWRFRWLLPYIEILLCFALLFPYRASIMLNLFHVNLSSGDPVPGFHRNPDGTTNLDTQEFDRWSRARDNAFDLVGSLNLPGMMLHLPYAILSKDHQSWTPGHIDFRLWRALTSPIFALPFWWIAGRGLEALIAARRKLAEPRIGWFATIFSFLLMAGGATLVVGVLFFSTPDDRADHQFMLLGVGALLWAVLASFSVIAKFTQWRIRKHVVAGVAA